MGSFIETVDTTGLKVSVLKTSVVAVTEEMDEVTLIQVDGMNSGLRIPKPYAEVMSWLEDK
jgi:hypothetical protein